MEKIDLKVCISLFFSSPSGHVIIEKYACFNNLFDIKCNGDQEVLVFESAYYGQNDTNVATKCETRYNRNCDVDVQLQVNRLCAGKSQCAIGVNKKLFELDPCGGEEFLRVKYRCAAGKVTIFKL